MVENSVLQCNSPVSQGFFGEPLSVSYRIAKLAVDGIRSFLKTYNAKVLNLSPEATLTHLKYTMQSTFEEVKLLGRLCCLYGKLPEVQKRFLFAY